MTEPPFITWREQIDFSCFSMIISKIFELISAYIHSFHIRPYIQTLLVNTTNLLLGYTAQPLFDCQHLQTRTIPMNFTLEKIEETRKKPASQPRRTEGLDYLPKFNSPLCFHYTAISLPGQNYRKNI
jgi:hypothetical protein